MNAQFTDGTTAKTYALAGNARLTLVSGKTGARFTYRISQSKPSDDRPPVHFVALLNGPNNDDDYTFLGTIFSNGAYYHGRNSSIATSAPSARAFDWAWDYLADENLPPGAETCHEGRCGRCGRSLTVPESVASGLGPICIGL